MFYGFPQTTRHGGSRPLHHPLVCTPNLQNNIPEAPGCSFASGFSGNKSFFPGFNLSQKRTRGY